jgi:pimeloyl-ACP methyl ester carboxylesterase
VGELIEQRHDGHLDQLAEPLADHFEQAGDWSKAASYCLLAAEKAKGRYSYASGVQLCRRALDLVGRGQDLDPLRIAALVLLGDLSSLQGDLEQANESYDRALDHSTDPTERRRIASRRHQPHSVLRAGGRIAYYIHGSGDETLVLVSPLLYGLESYQPVIEQLCQEFRIITIDPRGGGRSDPLPLPYTEIDHVEDIRAVIESVAAGPVVGIGASRGGNQVVRLAATYPHLMKGLVLVGTHIDIGRARPLFPPRQSWRALFPEQLTADNLAAALPIFASFVYSEPGTQDLADQLVRHTLSLRSETALAFFANDPTADMLPLLPLVRVPTLVMRGTADLMGSMEGARYLADQIAGAQFYVFEGRGHLPSQTATTEFCEVLRHFVRSGSVPTSGRPDAPAPAGQRGG